MGCYIAVGIYEVYPHALTCKFYKCNAEKEQVAEEQADTIRRRSKSYKASIFFWEHSTSKYRIVERQGNIIRKGQIHREFQKYS